MSASAPAVAASVLGPIEMTSDPRFARRVIRLAATSVIALGLIFFQYALMKGGSAPILIVLGAGWILMPAILVLSLRLPALRYGLAVPSVLVSFALAAICLGNIPSSATARSGWLLVTCGVWLGGLLGVWFWLRWLPVPASLSDPYSPGRWALIALHVGLVIAGLSLLIASDLTA
jgi:hypothetical protein